MAELTDVCVFGMNDRCDIICRGVTHVKNILSSYPQKQELLLDEVALVCQKHRVAFELEKLEKLQSKKRKFEELDEQIAAAAAAKKQKLTVN